MKRTPLQRRTPMGRGKPALKPQRPRDTGPSRKVRDVVKRRADWRCECCGLCPGQVIHHRDPRGAGGSSRPEVNLPSNLVYICEPCHLHVESRRLEAIGDGFLIPDGLCPADVPVLLHYGWHKLTDDGGTIPLPGRCRAGCAVWTSDNECDCNALEA
jgi:5-methylcytosine-specific restriction protein A